jgi:hypothetical protein
MSRRGAQLLLVAVLGLVSWGTIGGDTTSAVDTTLRDGTTWSTPLPASASGAEQLAAHLAAGVLGSNGAAMTGRARGDHASGAARVTRMIALVAVLLGMVLGTRARPVARWGHHALPVWSGWFTDPGRLRGPPAP